MATVRSGHMNAVEFIAQLSGSPTLEIPSEVAARLPKSGRVRVLVLTEDEPDDAGWRAAGYDQFLRDDSAEDAVYARGYEQVPEDISLTSAILPHVIGDAGDWE